MSPDELQERIVTLAGVHALVLAGPGCGKTHLLTRRIIYANAVEGIPFGDMVCLTFTNRASREMNARIRAELGYSPEGLFVGNLHRFCSRLLSENSLLPSGVSLLDEDDRDSWLAEALGARRRFERKQITDLAMLLFQQEHDFPEGLRRRLDFSPSQPLINAAVAYRDYKAENRLVDFDDLLLLAYLHLSDSPRNSLIHSSYRWIQVDEVQDLTPLQLAIIDLITADGPSTVVCLGDEQQAIFEFIGAGGPALDKLKQRCAGQIYRLGRNYRAPGYLVELCNRFAVTALGLPSDRLPTAVAESTRPDDALRLFYASDLNLTNAVASCVRAWSNDCPDERIAVLTRTNDEAEDISAVLSAHGIENTLVGRNDLFRQQSYKTVCAHLSAITDPAPSAEWTQLLYRTRAVRNLSEARGLMRRLTELSISPADLLSENLTTAVDLMQAAFYDGEIVVFDTETTGLDTDADEIVQIAAVRYRNGQPVSDGGFNVMIRTARSVPPLLSDGTPNPMLALHRGAELSELSEALVAFGDYVGEAVICAHNAAFDIQMLINAYRRADLPLPIFISSRQIIDTLTAARLLFPSLHSYKLSSLIDNFGLDGSNTHVATDDAAATASLLQILCAEAHRTSAARSDFLSSPAVRQIAEKFRKAYGPLFAEGRKQLSDSRITIAEIADFAYCYLVDNEYIKPISRWLAVVDFLRRQYPSARRLQSCLTELRTFNEGDLLDQDRVTVITVHKAKGLEFDNVIIYNVKQRDMPHRADESRVHYVAMSRARRRLAVFTTGRPTADLVPGMGHFTNISPDTTEALSLLERLHSRPSRD